MAELKEIVSFLDENLRTKEVPDYSGALNGLQLEGAGGVNKVVSAVDASLPVIRKAVESGADLLVVHHGMFWQGAKPLTGAFYEKVKLAMDGGMGIYSAHIPLDIHNKWGNNILVSEALGLEDPQPFFDWKGISLGLRQETSMSLSELEEKLATVFPGRIHICRGGNQLAGEIGIITGGAGSEVEAIAAEGINTFITGEGQHWTYCLAEELGVNLVYAGHYATETFGVKKVGEILAENFNIEQEFIDYPTGL